MRIYSLAIIAILAIALTVIGQNSSVPGAYPSYTITAELDTVWIGEDGFVQTDSACFNRLAYDHWYGIFSQYPDTIEFKIVKDLTIIKEYQDESRPTCTDINDYPVLICGYLLNVDFEVRVNWGEYCIYNNEY
jgi:hypothetical protein